MSAQGGSEQHRRRKRRKSDEPLPPWPTSDLVMPCCWALGEPDEPGFCFCSEPSEPGRPYCARHGRLAMVRVP